MRLHYEQGPDPSDRGQWFLALMGHRLTLSVVRIIRACPCARDLQGPALGRSAVI
jgi:hypothetical protein